MTTTQDNVELIEFNSPSSSKSYIKSKFFANDNRVESSPNSTPVQSPSKHVTDYSLFNKNTGSKLKPLSINPNRKNLHKSKAGDNLQKSNNLHNKFSESAFSVKSDGSSYREKFKERFESVKERAGKSAFTATFSKTKSKQIELLKRNMNLIQKQNQKVDLDFENYKDVKRSNHNYNFVSKAEAYSFFCHDNNTTNNKEINENEEGDTSEAIEKSTEVLIPISDQPDNDETYYTKSFADDMKLFISLSESNLFWRPSWKKLDTKEKLIIGDPRFLANEGLFVESKLRVQSFHLNILEKRLLCSKDKKWFNCEGELDTLPNPYSSISYRLQLNNIENLTTTYANTTTDNESDNKILFNNSPLKFEFISLKFLHHPLFSPEHVLEQKLIELYDEYDQLISTNKVIRIYRRLEALRNSNRTLTKGAKNNYWKEIKNLRELYFETSRHSRFLLQFILKTWKAIKNIRIAKGYSSTAIKLTIRKEKCNYETEKAIWDRNIQQTCDEILFELQQDYDLNMITYKVKLNEFKLHIKNNTDQDLLLEKPKKPAKNFDTSEIEDMVNKQFIDSFKALGEPILHLNLQYNNEISMEINNVQEKLRRNAVLSTKVFLKLLSNKSEICKLGPVNLNEDFLCLFNESISVQLSTALTSTNLMLEIYEQPSTMMKRKLGELKINTNIPQENALIVNKNKSYKQSFEKTEIVHYKHEGVGSGIELENIFTDIDDEHNKSLNTYGIINYKLQWHVNNVSNDNENELNGDLNVIDNLLNDHGRIDISKLIKWSNDNNPDPQDPKNASLFEYLNNYNEDFDTNKLSTPTVYFRYNQELSPLVFCDCNDIQNNVRFRVLELRNKNEPEFLGIIVPNNVKNIPLHVLDDYKRRVNEENFDNLSEDSVLSDNNIKSRRSYGYRLLMQVYIKIFQQCRNGKNNLTYEDVVNEKIVPYIESLARNIVSFAVNWIQAQPTIQFILPIKILKPLSNRKIELNKSIQILITVKSAINMPTRCHIQESEMVNDNEMNLKLQEDNVKYFVKATYQNIYLETSKVLGSNPVWNEVLSVPLETKSTDYMSPNSLSESISLNVFNEVTLKFQNKSLILKNWLGFVDIPISAIAHNNKIDGMFELHKPLILLGYEDESINSTLSKPGSKSANMYLYLKITLSPNIPKFSQNMGEIPSNELAYIKQYILDWNEDFNNKYPERKFSALVINIDGKSTCVTRYLKPLEPPQLSPDRFSVTADQCAAYVSMVPFTDTNHFYQNVWLTTEQLLKLSIGSVIDHAIALTCYLMSLNMEVWLLLGYGLPNGSTAYVLVREHLRGSNLPLHLIYDVVNGTKYNVVDDYCPLQKIFCIINERNIWANIQTTNKIQLTRFDFTRKQDWLTLFGQQVSAPTNSIQLDLSYLNTPDVKRLEIQIDKVIRKKFLKLRKQEITIWNHTISKHLKQFLSKFEINRLDDKQQDELLQVIRKLSQPHWISGYIVNINFRNIKETLEKVLLTDLHLIPGINTEFVMVVKVYSYPSYVLTVSICLAAIIKQLKD